MVSILKDNQHLVRYAHWAYMNDDGAEFRSAAWDLKGDVNYRKLKIVTPFFKDFKALTPNTHVHLGVRNGDTLVLAFRGTDFPFTIENLVNPKSTQWPHANIKCVTLGSPRVGNAAFCQRFNSSAIVCYRLEVDGDPIPTVPDRFTQAVPGKLPASEQGWTDSDTRYYHVGVPIILHEAGGRVLYNSVDYDVERPDLEAEKDAPPLPWQFKVPYELGGFLPYWVMRGLKMAPAIWQYHDPTGYETVVQRIVERTGEANHAWLCAVISRTPTLTLDTGAQKADRVNVAGTIGRGDREGKAALTVADSVVDGRGE
ncbi:hypothetical protein C8A03DRAFT_17590 [Achaetomium macrosporum]|uniref:Fungal lipase-type domain-containing protein n=1 Tax=Achaetomium macrosporum TaxID=79813 RepID=A0AAN7C5C1_9PEZI|nr:hypothetical protein C8A03DRAFT_17590 [Achaetomium macrosporum]